MTDSLLRVLVVDDSPLAVEVLRDMLARDPGIRVVASTGNGEDAYRLVTRHRPSVVLTDLHMPGMDGLALTRRIHETHPTPVLVVTASPDEGLAFRILRAGAVDVFLKPEGVSGPDYERKARELVAKVRVAAGVSVFTRHARGPRPPREPASAPPPVPAPAVEAPRPATSGGPRIVVMGASTGGPQTLERILAPLPADFPLPIVCVQHISENFLRGFRDWLDASVSLRCRIPEEREQPVGGHVYLAADHAHLVFDAKGRFAFDRGSPIDGHLPSATATMRSAAQAFGPRAAGFLLTGMGRDGAEGLLAMRRQGGLTVAQDGASCVVNGMPAAAVAVGAAQEILTPERITARLLALGRHALGAPSPGRTADARGG